MGSFVPDALRAPTVTLSYQRTSLVPPRRKYGTSQVSFQSFKSLPVPPLRLQRSRFDAPPVAVLKPLPVPWKQNFFDEFKAKNVVDPWFVTRALDIPVIDLAAAGTDSSVVVEQVLEAACTVGFVQVVNHGLPLWLMEDVILASKAGLGPEPAGSWYVPEVWRKAVVEWDEATKKLGEVLLGLMSEGFGLKREALEQKLCMEARIISGNHYPYCPQPDLTGRLKPRIDPVLFTLLLPDQIPGLQVEVAEHVWANLVARPGALVLNVGEVLQIISDNQYKSAEHRVLANSFEEPRILVAVFSSPANSADPCGPLPELMPQDEAAYYHDFDLFELQQQIKKEVGAKTSINNHNCHIIDQISKWNWNPLDI